MPELPEIETVRIGLATLLPGRTIKSVNYDWNKSFPNLPTDVNTYIVGAKIVGVRRRAKVLLIDLVSRRLHFDGSELQKTAPDTSVVPLKYRLGSPVGMSEISDTTSRHSSGYQKEDSGILSEYSLVIHLKMTGQLVFRGKGVAFGAGHPTDSLVSKLPDKSTRVTFTFKDGAKLFFNDQRKFGWVKLYPTIEVPNIDFFKRVGPEPLSADFTQNDFRQRLLKRPNTNIKAALLDQSVIAGVGNIYADESLWGAKIHPSTLVKNLTSKQINTLYDELRYVLNLSIEKGGSTDKNYVNADGKKGSYLGIARVFRREGQACPRCGSTIIKTRVAGRGTHICPTCQKEPK